jgi:PKD repeat protein
VLRGFNFISTFVPRYAAYLISDTFLLHQTNKTMKLIYLFLCLFCSFFQLDLQAQGWQFAKRYSAAISASFSNNAIANAPDGSLYMVGQVSGNVVFDTVSVSGSNNVNRGYLLKLDPAGQAVWVKLLDAKPYHVTCDAQGNVFWGGALLNVSDQSDSLAIIHKYSPTGQIMATYQAGGTARSWVRALKTDAVGNCYATGWKSGDAVFGPYSLPNSNSRDNFLVQLSPDLSQVSWAVQTGSSGNLDEVFGIELDAEGGVYTSGNYSQNYQLIPCACYNGSFFTEKRSAVTGGLLWQKIFSSGSGTDTKQFVTLSDDGQSLYVTASFKHTTQISTGISLTAASGSDDYHLFITKMSSATGNVDWAKKITLTGDSYLYGTVWSEDHLHLHGFFRSATLAGSTLLEPVGSRDAFYIKVTPSNGSVAFAEKFTGSNDDRGYAISADYNNLSLGGYSKSPTLTIGSNVVSGSSNSIYVTKKSITQPLIISLGGTVNASCPGTTDGSAVVAVQGGIAPYSFLWSNGQTDSIATMLQAGTYTVTVTDNAGTQASTTLTITAPPALTVGFSFMTTGLNASFSNTSANAVSYTWHFGDGQSSTQANPMHSYGNNGTYTVMLIAQNQCGADTLTQSVTLGIAPSADFEADKLEVCAGDPVQFNNLSAGADTYSWELPGASPNTSVAVNPMVVYTTAGVYPVTLTASNAFGSDVQVKTAFITVIGLPMAGFASNATGLSLSLQNNSQFANSYTWHFGDGQSSTQANPMHSYGNNGTYTVMLIAQNQCGADTLTQSVTLGIAPSADFEADKLEVCAGDPVQFTNLSAGADTYSWEFPGASPNTSVAVNPMVVYTTAGVYPVTLTASNAFGADVETKTAFITVIGFPAAAFTIDSMGLTITLVNVSQNADTYMWNFGDGNTSLLAQPTHTYTAPGHYVIQLTAQNQCGASILEKMVSIGTSATLNPAWLEAVRIFPNPNKGDFTLEMTGEATDNVQLSLFSPDGRLVSSEAVAFGAGRLLMNFEYENLHSGVYLLQIQALGSTKFLKVVVQR